MDGPGLTMMLVAVFAPLVAGALTMALPARWITVRTLLALAGPVASVWALLAYGSAHGVGAAPTGVAFVPELHLHLTFLADGLGMFFALLVSGIGALIVLYARGYFGPDAESLRRFYPTLGFFATAMLGIVLSDNMLSMFLFWELTSVSSFLLIGWDRENPRAVRLAMQAFVVTGLGGMALLGGAMALGVGTGAWAFSDLSASLGEADAGLVTVALVLMFVGGAAKSAQWPLHFWLPGAMAAPTPVSAYLHSATMVKAGVYLFARLFPALGQHAAWAWLLVGFGSVTMLLGAFLALRSQELKRIFAYTTVSQLGLLTCAYGLGGVGVGADGEPNLVWPITQILNHALYKAPLFIIAGAIMHLVGRKELHQLRGLWRSHRLLALICLAGCYGLAAGPGTLSFIAKEAFLKQVVHAAESAPAVWIVGAMTVVTAAINMAIFVRFLTTFVSAPHGAEGREEHDAHARADHHEHHAERGFWGSCIWWPAAALVVWQFVGGLAPGVLEAIVRPVETHALGLERLPNLAYIFGHPGLVLAMSAIGALAGVALGLTRIGTSPLADAHDRLFPGSYKGLETLGYRLFRVIQSGSLRTYVVLVLAALLAGQGFVWLSSPEWRAVPVVVPFTQADFGVAEIAILLSILICLTSLLMPMTHSRIIRVLILGACGFSVTGMYLLYQAPDLALTQLMFEIISVVLFLLVLRLLPEEPKRVSDRARPWRAIVAASVGIVVGWTVLHAGSEADRAQLAIAAETLSAPDGDPGYAAANGAAATLPAAAATGEATPRLGRWFLDHSYKGSEQTGGRGGGGSNVVNVILVDFRGYDTMGEITVLSIAVMGVLALLAGAPKLRLPRHALESATFPASCPLGPQPHLRSSLLRTSMRLILPLSLIFAGYVFFKGHNEPGGGFIAGMIAAVGLAVYRMSEGGGALRRLLPFHPGKVAVVGLTIALVTGVAPLLAATTPWVDGAAFLESYQWYVPRPNTSPFHMPSVMFFDLGVFIVVVGVAVGMINRFEEELE
jgi:multicomponent K+:H+ antiporter subunit A